MTSVSRRGLFGLAAGGVAAAALPALPAAPAMVMKSASCGMTEISTAGLLMALGGMSQIYNPRKAD